MKKIALFAVAIAIGFAGIAQTAPAKKDDKTPAKTEQAPAKAEKKDAKKVEVKKADVKPEAKTEEKKK